MKVGDLVTMDYTGWPEGDQWGIGIIVEICDRTPNDVVVFWSKLEKMSWEPIMILESVNESR